MDVGFEETLTEQRKRDRRILTDSEPLQKRLSVR